MPTVIKTALGVAALAALSGCNDNDGASAGGLFGLGGVFEQAFNADITAEPIDPAASALTVDLLADPFDI